MKTPFPMFVGYLHGTWSPLSWYENCDFVSPWDRWLYILGHMAGRQKRREINGV